MDSSVRGRLQIGVLAGLLPYRRGVQQNVVAAEPLQDGYPWNSSVSHTASA